MPALSATKITRKQPFGPHWIQTFEVTTGGNPAETDEHIVTEFRNVIGVLGSTVLGTAERGLNFVLNAEGTADAQNSSYGNLAVEATSASTLLQVTVIGE